MDWLGLRLYSFTGVVLRFAWTGLACAYILLLPCINICLARIWPALVLDLACTGIGCGTAPWACSVLLLGNGVDINVAGPLYGHRLASYEPLRSLGLGHYMACILLITNPAFIIMTWQR